MNVTIKMLGALRHYAPDKRENVFTELPDEITIRELLRKLGAPDEHVWFSAVNGRMVDEDQRLNDGDVLEVFEPVGGG